METCLNNLINGNCTHAQRQATRISARKMREYLRELGYNGEKTAAIILYLKKKISFREYCRLTEN